MVKEILTLVNGVLYTAEGKAVYDEADYFADVEEAQRWLKENGSDAKVVSE